MNNNSWHGSIKNKRLHLEMAIAHRLADDYRQDYYGESWQVSGCSVGCSVRDVLKLRSEGHYSGMGSVRLHRDGYPKQGAEMHLFLADALGVPVWVIDLQEAVFEALPHNEASHWTENFFDSIPVGVDLSLLEPLVANRVNGCTGCIPRLWQGDLRDFYSWILRSISSLGIEQKGG